MNIAVSGLAGAATPIAASALCSLPADEDDPIFAAISHERQLKAAYDAAHAHEDQLQANRPEGTYLTDEEGCVFMGVHIGKNYSWRTLLARNVEELYDCATVIAIDRGLPLEGTPEEKNQHYGWRAWGDDVRRWDARLNEVEVRREASRKWREETGYDAAMEALCDAGERLREAQKALLETQPTTVAGLMVYLDWLATDADCDVIEEHGETAFATVADAVRNLVA